MSITRRHPGRARLLAGLALAAIALGLPATAKASLGVAPIRADAPLEAVRPGLERWLQKALSEMGVAAHPIPAPTSRAAVEAAAAQGLPHVLLPALRTQDGKVTVELLLLAPATGRPLASARRSAPFGEIGQTAARALEDLGNVLGAVSGGIAPPLLEDLAATSLGLSSRAAGDLPGAWRAVQGKLSPLAMALREEIVEEARRGGGDPASRARVLAAAGDDVGAWALVGRDAADALDAPRADPQLLLAAGEVLLARKALREARRYFERALDLAPETPDAAIGLAEVLELQQDAKAAVALLERAAQLAPDDMRPVEALARLASNPQRQAHHWTEAGRRAARRLQVQRARSLLDRAAQTDASSAAAASAEVGALEERLGRPQKALAAYGRATQGGVRTPQVLTAVGRSQRRLGQHGPSESSLNDALSLAPGDPAVLQELGTLYTETGREAEAVPLLRAAHEAAPDDAAIRTTLAHALRATGDADAALAIVTGAEAPTAPQLAIAAELYAERGEPARAREALEQAVVLQPADPDLRTALARALDALGDAAGAAAQRQVAGLLGSDAPGAGEASGANAVTALSLDDLVTSFAMQIPRPEARRILALEVREPTDWRTLAWRAVRPRSPDLEAIRGGLEAAIAARFRLERRDQMDPAFASHVDRLYAFESNDSLDVRTISTLNQVLAVDGVFVTRLVAHAPDLAATCGAGAFAVEMRLLSGRDPGLVEILSNLDCLAGGFAAYGRWNPIALVLYGLLALLLAWPVLRGWGAIQVKIELPERTKGFFSIHITKRPDRVKREQVDKRSRKKKTRTAGRLGFLRRFERHMAGRETTFHWIPARKAAYTVTVAGPLLDARGEEIIGHFLEEQRVVVRRGRASLLVFDFCPKECAVEVRVTKSGQPAAGARVAVLGDPTSLRYARDGLGYLYLGLGHYTILVGAQAAATCIDLHISSLDAAIPLEVDLAMSENLVVDGSPEAVEAYLQSDLATAAQALEMVGQVEAAHRMRADHFHRLGRGEDAARELEAAGDIGDAAAIRRSGDDFSGSATLFEQAGEFDRAAEAYRAAGAWSDAGRCYELAYDYGNAVECWRESGDTERELAMLEKLGEYMDAAALARELGDDDRALQNLQQIDTRHHYHGEACRRIAEIATERGDHDLAIAKLEESMASVGKDNASVETLELYAGVLERAGRPQQALDAWQAIRRRDALRTDVAARIQELERSVLDGESVTQRVAAAPEERRYELLEEIGRGGMGVVYKARDKRLGRVVALKQLPENLKHHPTAVELFEREARAAAALNHANIVTLFDAGQEDGAYFITMELLEGRPLNAVVERKGRVSVRDTLRLGVQICAGLHYAHERRIVHRDIKTANLFFTREQVVKIMDFGISKSLEEVRRSTTVVGGTPYYMAPEQAAGEGVDHRADLYALGVTLFQLVTGELPFAGGDVTYRHRHEAPPDPRELNLKVPEPVSALILELMQKAPAARPASAAVVGARIQELLAQLG